MARRNVLDVDRCRSLGRGNSLERVVATGSSHHIATRALCPNRFRKLIRV